MAYEQSDAGVEVTSSDSRRVRADGEREARNLSFFSRSGEESSQMLRPLPASARPSRDSVSIERAASQLEPAVVPPAEAPRRPLSSSPPAKRHHEQRPHTTQAATLLCGCSLCSRCTAAVLLLLFAVCR